MFDQTFLFALHFLCRVFFTFSPYSEQMIEFRVVLDHELRSGSQLYVYVHNQNIKLPMHKDNTRCVVDSVGVLFIVSIPLTF